MHVVATEAAHAVCIHDTLHKIIALHSILVRGAISEVGEALLTELVLFQLPEILEIHSHVESDRPIVIFAIDRILQGLPLRVALNADIGPLN